MNGWIIKQIEHQGAKIKGCKEWLKKEVVFTIAILLAVGSCFLETPKWSYIDFKVLIALFNLMLVIAAFKEWKLLDYLAMRLLRQCQYDRQVGMALVGITFVAAMFMTNDIALITFVPLTIIAAKRMNKSSLKWIVYETLAANLGSSFTPMGNPQNLFIYTYYDLSLFSFIKTTGILMLVAILFLGGLLIVEKNEKIHFDMDEIKLEHPKKLVICIVLFVVILWSVLGSLNHGIALVLTVAVILGIERKLFFKVDYTLLFTFIGFFIFVGNISALPVAKNFFQDFLNGRGHTYWSGVLLSQLISNVPATMLLAPFTESWKELVLGVDVGGMGTLIASLASVISYKIFTKEYPDEAKAYMKTFTLFNLVGLMVFSVLCYIIL